MTRNLSYSFHNPYDDDAAIGTGFIGQQRPGTTFAVAADVNPGAAGGNSANHDARGQNVLYGDGHVEWTKKSAVGVSGDNIYTARDGNVTASPVDRDDSILLPTDD